MRAASKIGAAFIVSSSAIVPIRTTAKRANEGDYGRFAGWFLLSSMSFLIGPS